jgi:hypothetical protein
MQCEPNMKKRKTVPTKPVVHIDDFDMGDVFLQPIIKNAKCTLVPLTSAVDKKSVVLVQLSGGGKIPLSFGIDDKDIDGRRKVSIALQIDSDSDHVQLERLRMDLVEVARTNWSIWYPDAKVLSDELIETLCASFVSIRKKKKNSEDRWPGISKAAIEPNDCISGRCKIVDRDTNESIPFCNVPGMMWHKAIIELRYIYIQSTRSYGIARKLRYLSCSECDEGGEVVPI